MQARIAPGSGDAPWVLLPGLYQALHETPPPRLQLVPDTFRLCNAGPFLVLLLTSKTHSWPGQRGSEVQLVSRVLGCCDFSEGTLCYGESMALPGG